MNLSCLGLSPLIAQPPALSEMNDEVSQASTASGPQYTPNMKFCTVVEHRLTRPEKSATPVMSL